MADVGQNDLSLCTLEIVVFQVGSQEDVGAAGFGIAYQEGARTAAESHLFNFQFRIINSLRGADDGQGKAGLACLCS